jgi:long-chain acyl-CoA synthetase
MKSMNLKHGGAVAALLETLGNRCSLALDRRTTIASVVRRAAERWPDRVLLRLDRPLGYAGLPELDLTGRVIGNFVDGFAMQLRRRGLQRFERVAICKRPDPDYALLTAAIVAAGGIAVPVHSRMPAPVFRDYLAYTGATVVVTDAETFTDKIGAASEFPAIKAWFFPRLPGVGSADCQEIDIGVGGIASAFEPALILPGDHALICHTSGTTGTPKGVLYSAKALLQSARRLALVSPATRRAQPLLAFPFNHKVAIDALLATFLSGFPVCTATAADGPSLLERIAEHRITAVAAFPDVFLELYDAGLDSYDLSSVTLWVTAGDAAHEAHMRAFIDAGARLSVAGRRVPISVFIETLGSSEVGEAALFRLFTNWSSMTGQRFIGKRYPGGPRIKIADADGRPVPTGEVGRFMVRSSTLFSGYWNAHSRLHEFYRDGWLWTGDCARQDGRKRFYHLDRLDDVILTKAGPVYSLPIEEVVLRHPAVAEAVVLRATRENRDSRPLCLVNAKRDMQVDPEQLREWANQRLADHQRIAEVHVVPRQAIPRGLTGKVLKRTLRDRYSVAKA